MKRNEKELSHEIANLVPKPKGKCIYMDFKSYTPTPKRKMTNKPISDLWQIDNAISTLRHVDEHVLWSIKNSIKEQPYNDYLNQIVKLLGGHINDIRELLIEFRAMNS